MLTNSKKIPTSVLVIVLLTLLIQLSANLGFFGYGYSGDELYYLACADHLDLGYVDHPPFSIWVLAGWRWLFGDSLFLIRILPAFAGFAVILVTWQMTCVLGGGLWAQRIAALASACAPIFRILSSFYSMNAWEILLWSVSFFALIRLLQGGSPRWWGVLGITLGLSVLNKHTAGIIVLPIVFALLASPARRHLTGKWPWLGGCIASVILLPNLLWQIWQGFPSLEFYRNAQLLKNVPLHPAQVLLDQILVMHPLVFPIWGAGILWYLLAPAAKPVRAVGWIYLFLLTTMLVAHSSRPDRIAGSYPMLLAGGAVGLEYWLRARWSPDCLHRWTTAYIAALLLVEVLLLPVTLPIVPPALTAQWGLAGLVKQTEKGSAPAVPQYLSDRLNWEPVLAAVTTAYHRLTPKDRHKAVIYAGNYSEASAINFFGKTRGLPRAITAHNNYYLWGPGSASGEVVIFINLSSTPFAPYFAEIHHAGEVACAYCSDKGKAVFVVRQIKSSLATIWPALKEYK